MNAVFVSEKKINHTGLMDKNRVVKMDLNIVLTYIKVIIFTIMNKKMSAMQFSPCSEVG